MVEKGIGYAVGLGLLVAACGPGEPEVYYGGRSVGVAKPWNAIVVFRATIPDRPHEDLGTIRVTCPTAVEREPFVGIATVGGCGYEYAIYLAKQKVANTGADGLFGVETATAPNGNVVALTATAFRFSGAAPAPSPPSPSSLSSPPPAAKPSVDERLHHLQKLRDDGVITPEDFERRKAEILKEL